MEQKLEEVKKEDNEQADEYFGFIKSSVDSGGYFKDALDWYFFRYVTPICDRTLLIFGAILAAVVLFFLVQMVKSAFPLVERVPVFVAAKDQTRYFPNLVVLKPKKKTANYDPAIATVDEAVVKYLLTTYIQDREGYDFSKAEIEDVNKKFNHVRNVSVASEYKNFQLIMSKDNPDSPIHQFGQNAKKIVTVDSVHLVKKEAKDFTSKAKDYLSNKIPTEAEVRFSVTTRTVADDGAVTNTKEKYLAKINFNFGGVSKDEKSGFLKFVVSGYNLFKVK